MPIKRHSRGDLDLSQVDWKHVDATTDADIAAQAAADPDTAPVRAADEMLHVGRRIQPDAVEDVRTLRHRRG